MVASNINHTESVRLCCEGIRGFRGIGIGWQGIANVLGRFIDVMAGDENPKEKAELDAKIQTGYSFCPLASLPSLPAPPHKRA